MSDDLVIAAVPPREDPRDALVTASGGGLEALPRHARVGTGSLRRRAQLLADRDDLDIVAIRGNVETRLGRVLDVRPGERSLDAVVLAMAGLKRAGLAGPNAAAISPLAVERFLPAAGQGALAVQCAAANDVIRELVGPLDDPPSHQAFLAERAVLLGLAADCHSCLAVYIQPQEDLWQGRAMVARPDGTGLLKATAKAATAQAAARALLETLLRQNATELLR